MLIFKKVWTEERKHVKWWNSLAAESPEPSPSPDPCITSEFTQTSWHLSDVQHRLTPEEHRLAFLGNRLRRASGALSLLPSSLWENRQVFLCRAMNCINSRSLVWTAEVIETYMLKALRNIVVIQKQHDSLELMKCGMMGCLHLFSILKKSWQCQTGLSPLRMGCFLIHLLQLFAALSNIHLATTPWDCV